MKLSGLVRGAMLLAAMSASPCMGQNPGDWNNDGYLTPADVSGLDSCMLGPDVQSSGTCKVVYHPLDLGYCGLIGAMALQAGQTGTTCEPRMALVDGILEDLHTYAGLTIPLPIGWTMFWGAEASIAPCNLTQFPLLLGEAASATSTAFSDIWVNLSLDVDANGYPTQWAQRGITRDRSNRGTTSPAIQANLFFEGRVGPGSQGRYITYWRPADIGWNSDWCVVPYSVGYSNRTYGTIVFYDGEVDHPFHPFFSRTETHSEWIGLTPRWITIKAETYNTLDHAWGQPSLVGELSATVGLVRSSPSGFNGVGQSVDLTVCSAMVTSDDPTAFTAFYIEAFDTTEIHDRRQ